MVQLAAFLFVWGYFFFKIQASHHIPLLLLFPDLKLMAVGGFSDTSIQIKGASSELANPWGDEREFLMGRFVPCPWDDLFEGMSYSL